MQNLGTYIGAAKLNIVNYLGTEAIFRSSLSWGLNQLIKVDNHFQRSLRNSRRWDLAFQMGLSLFSGKF